MARCRALSIFVALFAVWAVGAWSLAWRRADAAPPLPPATATPAPSASLSPAERRLLRLARGLQLTTPSPSGELLRLLRRCGLAPDDLMTLDEAELVEAARQLAACEARPSARAVLALSNVERALASLVAQGKVGEVRLAFLSGESRGLEGAIYADLRRRIYRATTGADEGFDTSALACHPYCVFVPREEANALSEGSWARVLLHEARHLEQLRNNPHLPRDFRDRNGRFTTYAAFCEACADEGLDTTPVYRSRERMWALRQAMGSAGEEIIARACRGDKAAYEELVRLYNAAAHQTGAFARLFPPYR